MSIHPERDEEYSDWREVKSKLLDRIAELESRCNVEYTTGFRAGHSAGYAARDKLSMVNCGDGGHDTPPKEVTSERKD